MSRRNCCIHGCHNSGVILQKWCDCQCEIHGTKRQFCECLEPFSLIPFPSQNKQPELGKGWTQIVNRRQADNKSKIWHPNNDSRICSDHFESPDSVLPTLNLGYDTKIIKRRKPPAARSTSGIRSKKCKTEYFF